MKEEVAADQDSTSFQKAPEINSEPVLDGDPDGDELSVEEQVETMRAKLAEISESGLHGDEIMRLLPIPFSCGRLKC